MHAQPSTWAWRTAPSPVATRLWAQAPGSSTGSCPPSSFQCRASGYCVPLTWRCDGDPDCSDGSDEEECRIEPCTQNGQCPPPPGLPCSCDNISDCPGGGHQGLHNCSRQPCPAGEIRCSLGDACIPHTWRCDGHRDCPDSSDELGCEINETLQDRNATTAGTPVTPTTVTPLRNATAASVGYQAANPSAYGLAAAAVVLSAARPQMEHRGSHFWPCRTPVPSSCRRGCGCRRPGTLAVGPGSLDCRPRAAGRTEGLAPGRSWLGGQLCAWTLLAEGSD
uniref:CD320 molecule n=1 Tax=Oryctolagus cuniculus TaxID=9986 RepID=G1TMS9_RABIT